MEISLSNPIPPREIGFLYNDIHASLPSQYIGQKIFLQALDQNTLRL